MQAYGRAVQFTGKVVALVGITLAAGVVTRISSSMADGYACCSHGLLERGPCSSASIPNSSSQRQR
jgi:hypothetical protein